MVKLLGMCFLTSSTPKQYLCPWQLCSFLFLSLRQKQLREKKTYFGWQLRRSRPNMVSRHGSRSRQRLATLCQREMNAGIPFTFSFLFIQSGTQGQGMVLPTYLWTCQEVCLLADSKSSQVEDDDRYRGSTLLKDKLPTVTPAYRIRPRGKGNRKPAMKFLSGNEKKGKWWPQPQDAPSSQGRRWDNPEEAEVCVLVSTLVPSPFLTNCKHAPVQGLPWLLLQWAQQKCLHG